MHGQEVEEAGNQFAFPAKNVRGMSHGPRCVPASTSKQAPTGTGSTEIQALMPRPSTL